jgi:hypothetical protein
LEQVAIRSELGPRLHEINNVFVFESRMPWT